MIRELHATDHTLNPLLDEAQDDVLVVIGTQSCGACRRAKEVLSTLDDVGGPLLVVHVDAERAPGVVADLEVFHLPALVLHRDGAPWARVSAPLVSGALAAAVRAARSGPCDPSL